MSISTYDFLLSKVNRRLTKITTNYRSPISAEERLVVTLRYLATGLSFRSLAFAFRMGKSTVSNIVFETCQIIWEELVEEFMPIPTENCLKKRSNNEKVGDGTRKFTDRRRKKVVQLL
ncbi:unnamed protein product [Acanthoscelides obtectus]|uniref:Transposase Helix-turn-helix domain-containing protein n=1 Tax=Acanthoscelides obtectus TaxID=200917 RepID=A0A9P0M9P4_ACAOB|nr:unnamed protein product [Acanthoscelides obtectus]CAK1670580.1 hypothetical protein AOBTE_LOCUS27689 [Acanthoscelides obtectus]